MLDKTPFYGEMGGQVGDVGELIGQGFRFEVVDAQVDGGFTLHRGHLREGEIALGDVATARIDAARRKGIRRAHSATHLLHYALRKHLGQHAEQQGSKVDDDLLRFDFTNPKAVGREELLKIENEVNLKVLDGAAIQCENLPIAAARKAGATMLFGEKYPDVVRVVTMGDFSKELCGGTHLSNTAQVGLFKIIGEESVAAGTRRITALTGAKALDRIHRNEAALAKTAAALKAPAEDVPDRVAALAQEVRQLKKQIAAGPKAEGPSADAILKKATDLNGVKLVIEEIADEGADAMRHLIDQLRRKGAPLAVMLGGRGEGGKVTLMAGLSRDLVEKGLDAVQWVRQTAKYVQGGGGGRPDLAQAGGKNADNLPEALRQARAIIEKMFG